MIEWINNNKEWFLSGLGVFLLTIVSGIVKYMKAIQKTSLYFVQNVVYLGLSKAD